MKYYRIEPTIKVPWGDYGMVLTHGMAYENGQDGSVLVERTGPFVPPITIPGIGIVIATEAMKARLRASSLSGFTFDPVTKQKIVDLTWEKWDPNSEAPEKYPETGEPEDYINLATHSDAISDQIGDLWRLRLDSGGVTGRDQPLVYSNRQIWLVRDSVPDTDFFVPSGVSWGCVKEPAMHWLAEHCEGYLDFDELIVR